MSHESDDHRYGLEPSPETCRHCRLILSRQNLAAEDLAARAARDRRIEREEPAPAKACPRCRAEQVDGLLCKACAGQLWLALLDLPQWLHELDLTLARQDRTGTSGKATGVPMPIRDQALRVRDYVRNQLATWVRELDLGDAHGLADNPRARCGWLAARIERIRIHPAADECADEVLYCRQIIEHAVDARPERDLAGYCPVCAHAMYAPRDADTVTCRDCKRAGIDASYETAVTRGALAQRRLELRGKRRDMLVTRATALAAVAHMGRPVQPATFRKWVQRGREGEPGGILQLGVDRDGKPLYRLGDVMDRAGIDTRIEASV